MAASRHVADGENADQRRQIRYAVLFPAIIGERDLFVDEIDNVHIIRQSREVIADRLVGFLLGVVLRFDPRGQRQAVSGTLTGNGQPVLTVLEISVSVSAREPVVSSRNRCIWYGAKPSRSQMAL